MSDALLPGRTLLAAPSSCCAELPSLRPSGEAFTEGLLGPSCSSGSGGGDGSRGELGGAPPLACRAGDFAAIW